MLLTSFLNCSSALMFARALYRKDSGQVPLHMCLFRLSIGFCAFSFFFLQSVELIFRCGGVFCTSIDLWVWKVSPF